MRSKIQQKSKKKYKLSSQRKVNARIQPDRDQETKRKRPIKRETVQNRGLPAQNRDSQNKKLRFGDLLQNPTLLRNHHSHQDTIKEKLIQDLIKVEPITTTIQGSF